MIISTCKSGRVGNRLQISAFCLAYAAEMERKAFLFGIGRYAHYFQGPSITSLYSGTRPRYQCKLLDEKAKFPQTLVQKALYFLRASGYARKIQSFKRPFKRLETKKSISEHPIHIDGFYISASECLMEHRNIVREYFKPLKKIRHEVDKKVNKYEKKANRLVGIHARQGDYKKWESGRHFFNVSTYVKCAKNKFDGDSLETMFLVVSDERVPESIFSRNQFVKGPGTEIGDLYALSKCDFIVGPVSTYNVWASFYGSVPRYEMRSGESGPTLVYMGISKNLGRMVKHVGYDE